MADDVRRMSDELARDPASLIFVPLGEALRRQGQLDVALKVALRGLERHPHNAEAHDLLARISVDRGDLERAFDEWDMVLRLAPEHAGALKGLGFVCFRSGRLEDAETYLAQALEQRSDDQTIATALAHVRAQLDGGSPDAAAALAPGDPGAAAPLPADPAVDLPAADAASGSWDGDAGHATAGHGGDPRALFAEVLGDGEQTALLLDAQGLVMAGLYLAPDGRDVAQEVGAELSGVSEEAQRAMRHLGLGAWTSLVVESDAAIVAMAPASNDGLLVVAAARETPLGSVRRVLERAGERARSWLAGGPR